MMELMVSVVVLTVCVSLLSNTLAATVAHTVSKKERALAVEAAQNLIEDLHRAPFGELFALYNEDPNDDPAGAKTGPGPHFEVVGLTPRDGDEDRMPGRVVLPAGGGPLREDVDVLHLGLPRDLNGDHLIDGLDHSSDYIVLPVRILIEWKGRQGNRRFELTTMLADLTRL